MKHLAFQICKFWNIFTNKYVHTSNYLFDFLCIWHEQTINTNLCFVELLKPNNITRPAFFCPPNVSHPPGSTHTYTHSLFTLSLLLSLFPQRAMHWLIVWEVPLSSLAGLELLVRGHIRSFLWTRQAQRHTVGANCNERICEWRSKTPSGKLRWAILQRLCTVAERCNRQLQSVKHFN